METAVLTELPLEKPAFTPLVAGTEQAKQISKQGWLASKAKREERAKAKLTPCISLAEAFRDKRLARVRKQLDVLQDCFDEALAGTLWTLPTVGKNKEPVQVFDPGHIDRIAAAIARVAELERQLSDWALPGSRKPKAEPTRRANQSCDPVDE